MLKNNNSHIFIICEIAQAHGGSLTAAKKLITAAKIAKADAVKFQVLQPDELLTPDHNMYGLFTKTAFTSLQWRQLFRFARSTGLKIFADVFGKKSLALLIKNNIDGFKIHAAEVGNVPLLKLVAQQKKLVLLAASGSQPQELQGALSVLQSAGSRVVLLHGFQSYPTEIRDTNLKKIIALQKKFKVPVGFADHIAGGSHYKYDLCLMAVAMGCPILEKHITLNRKQKGYDYYSSLNPDEFKQFVTKVRVLEMALGVESVAMTIPERKYREGSKKHIVAARDLRINDVVSEENYMMKRTREKYTFQELKDIVGKRILLPVKKDEIIKLKNIEH